MTGILVLSLGLGLAMDVVREPVVRIDTGGAVVMHRTPVIYPDAAINRGVEGIVVVEATLDESGNVIDARVRWREPHPRYRSGRTSGRTEG